MGVSRQEEACIPRNMHEIVFSHAVVIEVAKKRKKKRASAYNQVNRSILYQPAMGGSVVKRRVLEST